MILSNAVKKADRMARKIPTNYSISGDQAMELIRYYDGRPFEMGLAFFRLGYMQGEAAVLSEWNKEPQVLKTKDDCKKYLICWSRKSRNIVALRIACKVFSLLVRRRDCALYDELNPVEELKAGTIDTIMDITDAKKLNLLSRLALDLRG